MGQKIFKKEIDENTLSINTIYWTKGIYYISIFNKNKIIGIEKIIKD